MKEEYELSNNIILTVSQDDMPTSPREFDNITNMVCFHKLYDLGDAHNIDPNEFTTLEEIEAYIMKEYDVFEILPLYLYDHSGITISTTPFSCRWDSGQIGFIYITKQQIANLYSEVKTKSFAKEILISDVEVYDMYLTGNIWGYTLEQKEKCDLGHTHREIIDSCWGFYGSDIHTNGILDNLPPKTKDELLKQLEIQEAVS